MCSGAKTAEVLEFKLCLMLCSKHKNTMLRDELVIIVPGSIPCILMIGGL